jgi:hypothetical protein
MAMPDQWTEIAWVAISDEDSNQYQFGTITDTIDISWGARDIESIATVSAGRVTKFIPEDVTEITLELFPVGISSDGATPNGIHGWFMGLSPSATAGTVAFARKKFRVVVLWTTLTSITNAAGALASGDHLRFSFWNAYLTNATADFTDDILKSTVTFKCPPYDRAANGLICAEEEDDGTLNSMPVYAGSAPPAGQPPWP